ncbi:MAG: transglycosylase domain-containing protein, partial [Solirubrobacteraceae bacterium]
MSRQARQRRRRTRSGPSRFVFVGLSGIAGAIVLGALVAVGYVLSVAQSAPSLDALQPRLAGASSQVFAADGSRLGFIQSDVLRTPITTRQMPKILRDATVAIEDQRFYKNNGVDLTGIFRSAVKDLTHGQALQGASTITMQLMRNLYLGSDTHSFKQKIDEAKLAIEYNERHSKRSILTDYLNSVAYGTVGGQTALGVQAAARIFFNESAYQLSLGQAALIAGLPQAPSQYNPFLYPGAARRRRNQVLSKMAELHDIAPSQAAAAKAAPLGVRHGDYYTRRQESFFFEYVRKQLVRRYGLSRVEQGGLKVYTTIDLNMQRQARNAIAQVLNEEGDPASAIVTINPHNGYIEAMAESEGYDQSQYNLASQGHRQPGSTFKAIVLADALSRGVDPNSTFYNSHTLSPGWLTGYPTYEVKTFENTSSNKSINLVSATLASDNTVYAQLAADLGEETITQMAHRLGVREYLHSYPAEALGGLTVGVSPLEMADVYATLADGGWRNTPIAITKVVFPDGHVDSNWGKPHRVKVLSDGVTSEETEILHQNVLGGTAGRSAINCPTAAKTGTTSNLVDAWLDGYTPNYSTAVWMGYPNKLVPMTDVHGEPQQGGYLPAEIWHAYMAAVTEGESCASFPEAKEPISYQPFFGKFASTGKSSSSESAEGESEKKKKKTTKKSAPGEHHSPAVEQPGAGNGESGKHVGGGESPETPAPRAREPVEPAPTPAPKAAAPP